MPALQRYIDSKDSGIEWVGKIPKHWNVKPLLGVASTESIKNQGGYETNVLSLSYGNIIRRDVEKNFGLLPESFNTYQLVNPGELILRLTDLQNDKRSLRVGYSKEKGIITSAYLKLIAKSNELDDRYMYRLLHSYDTAKVFYGMGGGLRQSMVFNEMKRLPMLLPSLEEQQKIANFLEHATAKIDTLIEKQQQLIKVLEEKRQSMVDFASQGAELIRLKNCSSQIERPIECFSNRTYTPIGLFNRGRGLFHKEKTLGEDLGDSSFHYVHDNDLILSGQFAWEGAVALTDELDQGCIASHRYPILQGVEGILDTTYLWAFFTSQRGVFLLNECSRGAAGRNRPLSLNRLMNEEIAIPPISKQLEISRLVHHERPIIEKISEVINNLRVKRNSLISAAVTGKIDVRNWQAPTNENLTKEPN